MTSQGVILRNGLLVGGSSRRVELPPQNRAVFEEGAYLIFTRWTALQLAVANEWGGSKSAQKAQDLLQDVIGWFYNTKGTPPGAGAVAAAPCMPACRRRRLPPCRRQFFDLTHSHSSPPLLPLRPVPAADHEMCDLQDLLDEALQLDFSVQAEDDSPYQVARLLVNMHNQVAAGNFTYVNEMRASAAAAQAAQAQKQLDAQRAQIAALQVYPHPPPARQLRRGR